MKTYNLNLTPLNATPKNAYPQEYIIVFKPLDLILCTKEMTGIL